MTKVIVYTPHGTCSKKIRIELEDGIVRSVKFTGGCSGNAKGIAALVEGMPAEEVVRRLSGTDCDGRGTSCPDQLARAIAEALKNAD